MKLDQPALLDIGKCIVMIHGPETKPFKPQVITGYHLDDEGHWVAQLSCGHNQHVRHDPPWEQRDWVRSQNGRDGMIGFELNCQKCVEGAPADTRPIPDEAAQ